MPYSARENDNDVIAFVRDNEIRSVLDVGAGSGTYGRLLAGRVDKIDAVEVWAPYIKQFELNEIYSKVINEDARNLTSDDFNEYDLVIFGDILEHMTHEESLLLWETASSAKYGLISVPVVHYPQGAEFGNPYEVHVQEHLHVESLRHDYGPFVFDQEYDVTGTFIRKF